MLTIFTTQKPTTGFTSQEPSLLKTAIHQINAIKSWGQIFGIDEILPLTIHGKLGPFNLPYVNELFSIAEDWAKNDLLIYANADLILLPDLAGAVERVAARFDRFLMVGQRWDVELDEPLDFGDPTWEDKLRNHVQGRGELHSVSGKDWMAFRRPLGLDIPPFVVGRPCWDNWVVDAALRVGIPVVDATRCVTAIHPEHGYPDGWLWDEASEHNRALCDVPPNMGRISEATWEMTARGEIVKREPA